MKKVLGVIIIIIAIAPLLLGIFSTFSQISKFSESLVENGATDTILGGGIVLLLYFGLSIIFFLIGLKLFRRGKIQNETSFEQTEEFKIYYKNSFFDMYQAAIYILVHSKQFIIFLSIIILVSSYLIYSNTYDSYSSIYNNILRILFVEFLIITLMFLVMLITNYFRFLPQFNKILYLENQIIVSNEGIYTKSSIATSQITWSGLYQIKQSKKYMYFYTTHMRALVIPKRIFNTPDDSIIFYTFILKHWEKENKL